MTKEKKVLKPEDIAWYLPFKLRCNGETLPHHSLPIDGEVFEQWELVGIGEITEEVTFLSVANPSWKLQNGTALLHEIKLILRPLTQLTEEIEHNGERFNPIKKLLELGVPGVDVFRIHIHNAHFDLDIVNYGVLQKLFEWHFDVFGLIDQGLAVPKT